MDNVLEYRGYHGSVEFSAEDRCFFGKLLFINDVIMYDGTSVDELEAAFRSQVDAYLAHCEERGAEPNKPCKGQFNVRVSPELHQKLAVLAVSRRTSLNDVVKEALECHVRKPDTVEHKHHHVHVMQTTTRSPVEMVEQLSASVRPSAFLEPSGIDIGETQWLQPSH
ncbi:type II toxin-antitoxin system HicB family antitoxin [Chitiniphilus purpureus]|uniref:Type II toxin-antitoxin system HicB family antitoxin n=1 Tax=Chitiniphilus purpureus TaxID=2981137 RepID=A0ABY6DQQ5_9NEIS|nr:type II toxin-antitoxin system HicB family antitoxin [Chitiniphilus sp. CD1]UXY16705.1 type II toxin-antitoxin system HicB family antitoxin [Chitiniphilus sp. CD1]